MVDAFGTPGGVPPTPDPNAPEVGTTAVLNEVNLSVPRSANPTVPVFTVPGSPTAFANEFDALKRELELLKTQAAKAEAERAADALEQREERRAQNEVIAKLLGQLKTGLPASGKPTEPEIPHLDISEVRHRIRAGFAVGPEPSASFKPHIFDLHNDAAFAALQAKNHDAATREFSSLYCSVFYLSCANLRLEEEIGDLGEGTEDHALFRPILNTLNSVESLLRDRLALCRAIALNKNGAATGLVKVWEEKMYGKFQLPTLGSAAFDAWAADFAELQTKASLKAAAAAGAGASRHSAKVSATEGRKPPAGANASGRFKKKDHQ